MKTYESQNIRNVVLLGHAGSGKTTLAETMLFESGTQPRRGRIDKGNTRSDFHSIEIDKRKSVFTTTMYLDWRGKKLNVLDTPGTGDYIGEVLEAIKVADTSLFVLNAERGVQVGTETLWKYAEEKELPSLLVVNQLDQPQSDFQRTVDMAKERFGREVVVVQYPYSEGEDFHAIIDVLKMVMYEFPESGGKPEKLPIPESHRSQADLMHNELVESVAENDELLMDMYIENGKLEEGQMQDGLHKSLMNRDIVPLFCMSALRNMGSGRIMGFLGNVAPSPLEVKPLLLKSGDTYSIDTDHEPSMYIFKTVSESHVGDMHFFKVIGGNVETGLNLVDSSDSTGLRLSSLFLSQGEERVDVSQLKTGDIGAAVKLKGVSVNDTLCTKGYEFEVKPVDFPDPPTRTAIRLEEKGEEDKLGNALHQLQREDPSLSVEHSQELRQIILHGQGEEHLDVIKNALENRFNLSVEYYEPRIPYRETIMESYRAHYRHKKQSGGAGQFAEIDLLIEPYEKNRPVPEDLNVRNVEERDLPWGGKLVFQNCIVGGVIDQRFMPAILKGIMEKMKDGPLSGCRVQDIRVSVYDGSMHSVDSNDAAFKTAALMAFRDGFMQAGPQLLEPIYEVDIKVPSEHMGDVMSDLSTRRGQIQGMDAEGSLQNVHAHVPLDELDHYSTQLKSITQGSASFTRKFSHYAPVPSHIQEQIIQEHNNLQEAS